MKDIYVDQNKKGGGPSLEYASMWPFLKLVERSLGMKQRHMYIFNLPSS